MDKFVYATFMVYAILIVLCVAFAIYILPALLVTIFESLAHYLHPSRNELVERLLLVIEEAREWGSEPGRHRPKDSGVHHADDPYFTDLIKMWAEVEDTLRIDLDKKVPSHV